MKRIIFVVACAVVGVAALLTRKRKADVVS